MDIKPIIQQFEVLKPLIDYDASSSRLKREECKDKLDSIIKFMREIKLQSSKLTQTKYSEYEESIKSFLDECSEIKSITSYCRSLRPIIFDIIGKYKPISNH